MRLLALPAIVDNYIWALVDADGDALVIDPGDAAEIVRLARVGASGGTHQLYIALALYYEITDGAAIILREIDVIPAGETPLALGKLIGGGGA